MKNTCYIKELQKEISYNYKMKNSIWNKIWLNLKEIIINCWRKITASSLLSILKLLKFRSFYFKIRICSKLMKNSKINSNKPKMITNSKSITMLL